MGTVKDLNFEDKMLDALVCDKITRFLEPPRRRDVFNALNENEELSQGELAKIVASSATALSNQLSKFEKFEYKLLEVQNVGKYRYYRLTECAKDYLQTIRQPVSGEIKNVSGSLESISLKEAEEIIKDFREMYADKWKSNFNKVLMRLVNGRGSILDDKGEMMVKRYLRCVERLSLEGNYEVLNSVLTLLSDDILRDDMEDYMEYFEPFIAVIRALECEEKIFAAYMLVQAAFAEEEESTIDEYIRSVEWNGSEYDKLKNTAKRLKMCVSEYNEEAIYRYFSYLLPDQAQLSAYIARCVCGDKRAASEIECKASEEYRGTRYGEGRRGSK